MFSKVHKYGITAQQIPHALVRLVVCVVEHELLLPATVPIRIGCAIERLTHATELLVWEYALDQADTECANVCSGTGKIADRVWQSGGRLFL